MQLKGFMSWADDVMNPIAVKEMRQAVKGRSLGWVLMIFVAVQLTVIGGAVLLTENPGEDFGLGRGVFMALQSILLGTCLLFLPVYTAVRISSERSDGNVDLLYITTLRPTQIIWGKFFAAMILTLLFFSASMPFMTLTYLLRGLDLPAMFLTLGFNFLVVMACVLFAILLACPAGGLIGRGIRFLLGLGALGAAFSMSTAVSQGMLLFGFMTGGGPWDFWGPALIVVGLILLVMGLLFILSATIITPASANKALGARIYLLAAWLATGILAVWLYFKFGDDDSIIVWAVLMSIIFAAAFLVACCERFQLGPRVARTIPRNLSLRFLAFPFYSGANRGMIYAAFIGGVTVLVHAVMVSAYGPGLVRSVHEDFFQVMVMIILYSVAYGMTAVLIRRVFFRDNTSPQLGLVIAVGLFVIATVVPSLLGLLARPDHRASIDATWYLANPLIMATYPMFFSRLAPMAIQFSAIWSGIALFANLSWMLGDMKAFKPLKAVTAEVEVVNADELTVGDDDAA